LEQVLGRKCGGSTGTNFYGVITLLKQMQDHNESGSIVTLICDDGCRYLHSYYNPQWRKERGIDVAPYLKQLELFWTTGQWQAVD
ncbi:MAG: PLP-dependent cysteine synthase family protein, partial [Gammaproteobacteria bacterium]|nr:PLP-dependent cysteine synthase family protein [Gammaproteobacteria bacterium]